MAKRVVQECDLCKGEYDPDDTHIISVKKKGKQKAHTYDLCPECAEKIQQQLVAKSSDVLPEEWEFCSPNSARTNEQEGRLRRAVGLAEADEAPVRGSRRAEITAQQEDDDMIARKEDERRAALAEAGHPEEEQEEPREVPYETVEPAPLDDGSCAHMNRGRIQVVRGQFVQECRDCGETLEPNSSSERAAYMGAKPGTGVTLSSHASDRRNRD
jgi:hypothetical protein